MRVPYAWRRSVALPVVLLDRLLRRLLGMFPYWDDPDCLFQIRIIKAPRDMPLSGHPMPAGAPVVELHFWNENVPPMPEGGPHLAWARHFRFMAVESLRHLAQAVARDPRLKGVQAVKGTTVILDPSDHAEVRFLFERFGFCVRRYRSPLGCFGEFWENLYTWLLMAAFNLPSLKGRPPFGLSRSEIWMPVEELLHRYGDCSP